jgi:hypothetical protein
MKKLIVPILFSLLACENTSVKQTVSTEQKEPNSHSTVVEETLGRKKLFQIEKIGTEDKKKHIGQLRHHFEYLASGPDLEDKMLDYFHFIDLDDDGDLDLLFDGWSGGEPMCIRIFNNKNGEYNEVFTAYQKITDLTFEDNKLSKLSVYDPGCCASYIEFDEDYEFMLHKDTFQYTLVNRTAFLFPTEKPVEFLPDVIDFEVQNEPYYLRLTPNIDTAAQVFAEDLQSGNIIATFRKGTKGKAYAEKSDNTGRVWWFVEIDAADKPIHSFFYDIDEKPTRLKGWMSSNYLKKVN